MGCKSMTLWQTHKDALERNTMRDLDVSSIFCKEWQKRDFKASQSLNCVVKIQRSISNSNYASVLINHTKV